MGHSWVLRRARGSRWRWAVPAFEGQLRVGDADVPLGQRRDGRRVGEHDRLDRARTLGADCGLLHGRRDAGERDAVVERRDGLPMS